MRALSFLAAAALLAPLAPSAAAQDEAGFLVEFNFDKLWIRFYPDGLGTSVGSGLQVVAENVRIEADQAVDLRHCIDGHPYPDCSYGDLIAPLGVGNKDGQVVASEVAGFEQVALLGLDDIEKLVRLADMLQHNVSVDGVFGAKPRVVKFDVRSAEGDVNSTVTAYADVTIEVAYANDKSAARHELRVRSFRLSPEGFVTAAVASTVVGDKKWSYKADQTQPAASKSKVTAGGWNSNQADFEAAADQGLLLVVEKSAKKRTPGFEAAGLAAASLLALAGARRR